MGLLVLYQQVLIRLHASLNTLHRENCGKLIVDQVGGLVEQSVRQLIWESVCLIGISLEVGVAVTRVHWGSIPTGPLIPP